MNKHHSKSITYKSHNKEQPTNKSSSKSQTTILPSSPTNYSLSPSSTLTANTQPPERLRDPILEPSRATHVQTASNLRPKQPPYPLSSVSVSDSQAMPQRATRHQQQPTAVPVFSGESHQLNLHRDLTLRAAPLARSVLTSGAGEVLPQLFPWKRATFLRTKKLYS